MSLFLAPTLSIYVSMKMMMIIAAALNHLTRAYLFFPLN